MGEILVEENTDTMWCISYLLVHEIQIQRKAPIKVSVEKMYLNVHEIQIERKAPIEVSVEKMYLNKENSWKTVSDDRQQNAFLSKENTYYIMNWLSFDMKKYI